MTRALGGSLLVYVLVVCLGGVLGCGSNGEAAHDAGVQHDVVGEDAAFASLTVKVVHGLGDPSTWPVVAGATAALDAPGGARVEKQTGDDGRATFTGLDFTLGTAAVTAHAPGFPLASVVGIKEQQEDVVVWLWTTNAPASTVHVSGTAANMASTSHYLLVESTNQTAISQLIGPAWGLDVAPGVPFTIMALEFGAGGQTVSRRGVSQTFYAWLVADHDAVTADTTIDLDLAQSFASKTAAGSFPLPTRTGSRLLTVGHGYVYVTNLDTDFSVTTGFSTLIDVNTGATGFDYTVEWVEVPAITQPLTEYYLSVSTGENAWVIVPGYPTAGAQDIVFIDLPDITTPADFTTPYPLHDPIAWTAYEQGLGARLIVSGEAGVVWTVMAYDDPTSLAVPQAPSTVDVVALLGTIPLGANFQVFHFDPTALYLAQGTYSATMSLAP